MKYSTFNLFLNNCAYEMTQQLEVYSLWNVV